MPEPERHSTTRIAWLRAAVLGANDGILSIASLVLGVAASETGTTAVLIAGIAGLVAGAGSMAVGEYVSVSSQKDTEEANLELERQELACNPDAELRELADIYVARGLSHDLAMQVAQELSKGDVLEAHARDELGITELVRAKPAQAAFVSFVAFAFGAAIPIITVTVLPRPLRETLTIVTALAGLAVLGGTGALLGGAPRWRASARVCIAGTFTIGLAMGIGRLLGTAVG